MAEFKITIGLPEQDYQDLRKRAEKYFSDNTMKIQRQFFGSCSTRELEVLYLYQHEKSDTISLIKRILSERYKTELSDTKNYFSTIEQFLMAHYSMDDTQGRRAKFKQGCLAEHFSKKAIGELAEIYNKLLDSIVMDEKQQLVINSMTEIILEKLDGNIPVSILNKLLNADGENVKLEDFIKEKFKLARA